MSSPHLGFSSRSSLVLGSNSCPSQTNIIFKVSHTFLDFCEYGFLYLCLGRPRCCYGSCLELTAKGLDSRRILGSQYKASNLSLPGGSYPGGWEAVHTGIWESEGWVWGNSFKSRNFCCQKSQKLPPRHTLVPLCQTPSGDTTQKVDIVSL